MNKTPPVIPKRPQSFGSTSSSGRPNIPPRPQSLRNSRGSARSAQFTGPPPGVSVPAPGIKAPSAPPGVGPKTKKVTTIKLYGVGVRTRRKRAARIWFLRNWFLFALILLAILGILLWAVTYFDTDEKVVYKNVTTITNITGYVNEPTNVMVLYDESGSVTTCPQGNCYQNLLLGAVTMIQTLDETLQNNFSAGGVRWSNDATVQAELSTNITQVLKAISASPASGGQTFWAKPLLTCREQINTRGQGSPENMRNGSFDLCILMTDGLNSDTLATKKEKLELDKNGIKVMGILIMSAIPQNSRKEAIRNLYEISNCPQNVTWNEPTVSDEKLKQLEMCTFFDTFTNFTTLRDTARVLGESLVKFVDVRSETTTVKNTTLVARQQAVISLYSGSS